MELLEFCIRQELESNSPRAMCVLEPLKVVITKDVLKRLEEAIKSNYFDYFATDGFFWGQQFQEEQAKEYKKMDLQFVKWCKEALKRGEVIEYSCSW